LDEDIHVALPFKGYCTLKHGSWPKDLDEHYFKGIKKKLMGEEHEGQVEEHASSHEEDVFIEEEQMTTYDTSS